MILKGYIQPVTNKTCNDHQFILETHSCHHSVIISIQAGQERGV